VIAGPLTSGSAKHAPYDALTIQGGVEEVPEALLGQLKDGGRIGAVFMDGPLGVAKVGYKSDGQVTWRAVFNAAAPVLDGFRKARAFAL
jgi:protein-L-isoaspartate(D-aspartate) O-methyltransferase